jgi:hypothetical protein
MPYNLEEARKRKPILFQSIAEAKTPEAKIRVIVEFFANGLSPKTGSVDVPDTNIEPQSEETSDQTPKE